MSETAPNAATVPGVRVLGGAVERGDEILTNAALEFVANLQRTFGARRDDLLARRTERRAEAAANGRLDFLPETKHIREGDWQVAEPPAEEPVAATYEGAAYDAGGYEAPADAYEAAPVDAEPSGYDAPAYEEPEPSYAEPEQPSFEELPLDESASGETSTESAAPPSRSRSTRCCGSSSSIGWRPRTRHWRGAPAPG